MSAIITDNSDLCVAGYVKLPSGSVRLTRSVFDKEKYQEVIMTRDIEVAVCKIYDADIIRKYKILFPVGMKASEDAVFYYRYLRFSQRCSFVDNADYIYYAPESNKDYGLTLESELIGLDAMANALISLMNVLDLDYLGLERLRQRIVLSLNRVMYKIYSLPFKERHKAYSKIDWLLILPYIKTYRFFKGLLLRDKYQKFELLRLITIKMSLRKPSKVFF